MDLFDAFDGVFSVLVNDEQQYGLWPSRIPVPTGWQDLHGPDTRTGCLSYIERNRTDLRPGVSGRAAEPTASSLGLAAPEGVMYRGRVGRPG